MNRDRWWTLQYRFAPYLFVSPFVILFVVFLLYPLGWSILLSFYQTASARGSQKFVGMENYRFLLGDWLFWGAVLNTAAYTFALVLIQIPTSLGLALVLNDRRVKLRGFFRFAFFSTYLVGNVFVAVLFSLLLSPRAGLMNRALGAVTPGGGPLDVNWLGDPDLAMPSVLLASLWLSVGYGMIYFLAALQTVDRELYESAEIDGAGPWSRFWNVTIPGIRPVLIFMLLVVTIGGFQLFELPFVIFESTAGPSSRGLTIVMYLWQSGWESGNLGYAAAIGWVLVILILAVAFVQLRATRAMAEV
jgi:ABC-type sugar transport system permease subunit